MQATPLRLLKWYASLVWQGNYVGAGWWDSDDRSFTHSPITCLLNPSMYTRLHSNLLNIVLHIPYFAYIIFKWTGRSNQVLKISPSALVWRAGSTYSSKQFTSCGHQDLQQKERLILEQKLCSMYLLLISTPRQTDHSFRAIRPSRSRSQYSSKLRAQALGWTSFLTRRRNDWISFRRNLLSLLVSSSENFHSMTRFSGVSRIESDSDLMGKSVRRKYTMWG